MKSKKALEHINKNGILLVYPIKNAKEPSSLWSELYPRTQMRWEWDADGDQKVSDLWILREELSTSNKVVYAKWYQQRATFFSFELYSACLTILSQKDFFQSSLSFQAQEILDLLKEDSPLSTKKLKKMTDLVGRDQEPAYNRALKQLWSRFQIVGFGEVDEGAFPSLAVGSSQILFEDLWQKSQNLPLTRAQSILERYMPPSSLWRKYWDRQIKEMEKNVKSK